MALSYYAAMVTVRTPEGSQRYNKPIGTVLDDSGVAEESASSPVSPLRLRSLRAIILAKMESGDKGAVKALVEKFRAEMAAFSKDKSQSEVSQALSAASAPAEELQEQ